MLKQHDFKTGIVRGFHKDENNYRTPQKKLYLTIGFAHVLLLAYRKRNHLMCITMIALSEIIIGRRYFFEIRNV